MTLLERLQRANNEKALDDKKNEEINSPLMPNKEVIFPLSNSKKDPHLGLKANIHKKLIEKVEKIDDNSLTDEINKTISELLEKETVLLPKGEREKIFQEIVAEAIGYGPIHTLLLDKSVSEIMVNGPNHVYVEREGLLERTDIAFRDDAHILHIIEKIVAPLGRRIDESMPMVDARLPDGSRVNAIIPPLALNGPTITIRKFSKDPFQIDDLIDFGTLSGEMSAFLEAAVKGRLNIIVSGGTGSGKTTSLNVLSSFIPDNERIVTIEDAAEIQLRQEHVITLEARPPNIEGKGAVTIRDLVRNSLRMRPERIVVGEVRGGEALDMLQAMNTGHDGSLTTGHSNSPRDMLARLETMVMMAGMDLPLRAIREQISSAIDIIIQQNRLRDGTRRITHITEVQGMEGDIIVMQDIFKYTQEGLDENGKVIGYFESTGIRPKFMSILESSGLKLPAEVFASSFMQM